jgi:hypothetical protein
MEAIEQAFAAAVANARGEAKILATAGCFPANASDQVAGALAVLWKDGKDAGMSADDIQAIANRWVEWDEDDNPWPRAVIDNVVPFRR